MEEIRESKLIEMHQKPEDINDVVNILEEERLIFFSASSETLLYEPVSLFNHENLTSKEAEFIENLPYPTLDKSIFLLLAKEEAVLIKNGFSSDSDVRKKYKSKAN